MNQKYPLSRRTVLKVTGTTLVGASLSTSGVAAHEHQDHPDWEDVSWGDPVSMGDGAVRTYVRHDSDGETNEIGLYFTEGSWNGLPSPEGEPHAHFAIDLPAAADATPFRWAGVDWAAEGHPPPGVYDLNHLDIHFYMMEQDAVHAIPPDDEYQVPLAADQHPPDYIRTHEVVPEMGEHLIDPTAPEFHGEPFTHTFIWGAYDGDLTFYEPMVTIDYLEGLQDQARQHIKMPAAFAEAGEYPTRYTVQYHPEHDAYTVSLDCFKSFDASSGVG
jgi:hypothetical protein